MWVEREAMEKDKARLHKKQQEKEIDHRNINDRMENGKQIHFVTNAHINKFYEIAPYQQRKLMPTFPPILFISRSLFLSAFRSLGSSSIAKNTRSQRFTIRQSFNFDRKMNIEFFVNDFYCHAVYSIFTRFAIPIFRPRI